MKNLLITICLFLTINIFGQSYPQIQNFSSSTPTWTFTNGAGIQYYGGFDYYATFNIGSTPYPNNSTVTITSPIYSFTNCTSGLTVEFPLNGIIENNKDIVSFEYTTNGTTWTVLDTYTGTENNSFYSYPIPNNVIQFKFVLVTSKNNNTYNEFGNTYVYYYDIDYFEINCAFPLPIDLLYFNYIVNINDITLNWVTVTETNNSFFTIEKSTDGVIWNKLIDIKGAGNSTTDKFYKYNDNNLIKGIYYYRLSQTDYNGNKTEFNIITATISDINEIESVKYLNILGETINQPVGIYFEIIQYTNGKTVINKKINN
jgi:hypothetical protein